MTKAHWSFWLICGIALFWNLGSVVNYFAQMNPEALAQYHEVERAIVEGRPGWATATFALAAFGGALGSVLLLLRRSAAFYLFIAALLGVLATTIHTLAAVGSRLEPGRMVGIVVMPIVLGAVLVWYAKFAERKNWVR